MYMDPLSSLLALHPVDAALDLRCEFDAPWEADHTPQPIGVAPYHVILAGSAEVDVPGHLAVTLHAGDMLMLPRGHAHRLHVGTPTVANAASRRGTVAGEVALIRNHGDGPHTELLCGEFHFSAATGRTLLDGLPDLVVVRHAEGGEWGGLRALVGMLRDETDAQRPGSATVVRHLASALFALTLRAWSTQSTQHAGLLALMADVRLGAAFGRMLAAPAQPWSVEALADLAAMSRATFLRRFRAASGSTPADVLLGLRMAGAAQRLATERQPMGEVAEAAGYGSEAAFNRAFRRYWGVAPGEYRRRRATRASVTTSRRIPS
jgi:AraC family transcriptional activator of mtrCDE